jgi:hypothetical protein
MEDIKSIVKEIKRVKSDVGNSNNYIQYSEYIAEQIDKTISIFTALTHSWRRNIFTNFFIIHCFIFLTDIFYGINL